MAILLFTQISTIFDRLADKAKHKLLQIVINRIIVDPNTELNGQSGSKQVSFGVLEVEQEKTRKKWLRRGFIFPCILRIALFVVAK